MSEPGSRGSSPSQQQTRKKKARKPRPAEPAESEIIDLQHRDYEEMVEMQLASPQTKKNKYRSEEKTPLTRAYDIDHFKKAKMSKTDMAPLSDKARKFYHKQNSVIELFEEVMEQQQSNIRNTEDQGSERLVVKVAIRLSFAINILLVCGKLLLAIRSNSMSVIASALDSILDILSGSVIFITSCCMRRSNRYLYPVGKTRLEPIGVTVFATLMFTAALQLVIESAKRLVNGINGQIPEIVIDWWVLSGLIATIVLKLGLFIFCRTVKGSSSVEALAQDHRNDVITNSFTIAATLIAYYTVAWYVDGIGGCLIGLYIMFVWVRTALKNIRILTGYTAPPELIKKWTYLALQHHPAIIAIDTVRAYHLAEGFVTELDIVLPPDMSLRDAHDIGESLQQKLEEQPEVERAFVHIDYEFDHKPEH